MPDYASLLAAACRRLALFALALATFGCNAPPPPPPGHVFHPPSWSEAATIAVADREIKEHSSDEFVVPVGARVYDDGLLVVDMLVVRSDRGPMLGWSARDAAAIGAVDATRRYSFGEGSAIVTLTRPDGAPIVAKRQIQDSLETPEQIRRYSLAIYANEWTVAVPIDRQGQQYWAAISPMAYWTQPVLRTGESIVVRIEGGLHPRVVQLPPDRTPRTFVVRSMTAERP